MCFDRSAGVPPVGLRPSLPRRSRHLGKERAARTAGAGKHADLAAAIELDLLGNQARRDVGRAAGREADQKLHPLGDLRLRAKAATPTTSVAANLLSLLPKTLHCTVPNGGVC